MFKRSEVISVQFFVLYIKNSVRSYRADLTYFSIPKQVDYIAWVCDQDAYACSGQKCSAQSILFMHKVIVKISIMFLLCLSL